MRLHRETEQCFRCPTGRFITKVRDYCRRGFYCLIKSRPIIPVYPDIGVDAIGSPAGPRCWRAGRAQNSHVASGGAPERSELPSYGFENEFRDRSHSNIWRDSHERIAAEPAEESQKPRNSLRGPRSALEYSLESDLVVRIQAEPQVKAEIPSGKKKKLTAAGQSR